MTADQTPVPAPKFNVLERPRYPRSPATAAVILSNIGDHEREIRVIEAAYSERIAQHEAAIALLIAERDLKIEQCLSYIVPAVDTLQRFYRNNLRRYGKGRALKLTSGTLKCELDKSWTVDVVGDEDDAVRKVRRRGMRFVTVKVTLNKQAIGRNHSRFARIAELTFRKQDRFRVIPANLGATPKPSVDRLSRIHRTMTAHRSTAKIPTVKP
jgi:phage host-nuclease inhibitor protein Gam